MDKDLVKTELEVGGTVEELTREAAEQIVRADGHTVADIEGVVAFWDGPATDGVPPSVIEIYLRDGTMIHARCEGPATTN